MFWNDIEEIREWMHRLNDRLIRIDPNVASLLSQSGKKEDSCRACDDVKEYIQDVFSLEDENSSINIIHDKLNSLINDLDTQKAVAIAEKTLDKFDDYMKNIDKLNGMINEFKGCVSLARGAIEDRKKLEEQTEDTKRLAKISGEIYEAMMRFIQAGKDLEHKGYYKINAIYTAICEKQEKKPVKKCKSVKKAPGRALPSE